MARSLHKLSSRAVQTFKEAGRYSDGGGLYLVVDKAAAKRWTLHFQWQGKTKEMGLGSFRTVSLAKARERAAAARELVSDGINPIIAKRTEGQTFGSFADALLDDIESEWRNEKHRAQWRMTLTRYAAPLRDLRLDAVTTHEVVALLKPIWTNKPETASRVRARIERVLDAAKAKGLRTGENPARWRGHLNQLLPKRQKLSRGHHAALPFKDMATFMANLRVRPAMAARALEFTILTAARSGETLGALWSEIDLDGGIWSVPAHRMKAGRAHRVALSSDALAILKPLAELREGDHVFPGQKQGRPLSVMSMEMVLRRMNVPVTVHGFRSSFRDWAADATNFQREVAEAALAHRLGDATETAYRRGDAFEKRAELMEAWATYCGTSRDRVVAAQSDEAGEVSAAAE